MTLEKDLEMREYTHSVKATLRELEHEIRTIDRWLLAPAAADKHQLVSCFSAGCPVDEYEITEGEYEPGSLCPVCHGVSNHRFYCANENCSVIFFSAAAPVCPKCRLHPVELL